MLHSPNTKTDNGDNLSGKHEDGGSTIFAIPGKAYNIHGDITFYNGFGNTLTTTGRDVDLTLGVKTPPNNYGPFNQTITINDHAAEFSLTLGGGRFITVNDFAPHGHIDLYGTDITPAIIATGVVTSAPDHFQLNNPSAHGLTLLINHVRPDQITIHS